MPILEEIPIVGYPSTNCKDIIAIYYEWSALS